jgi:hypothetical protein
MKVIGIQIKSKEAILVVLEKDTTGNITQTNECAKFKIDDPTKPNQVKQFRDQTNAAFDSIGASQIGIVARNANGKGDRAPSPISFKLEGIIQLYDKIEVELVWKQTTSAYFKKNAKLTTPKNKYQEDALDVALYLIK